MNQFTQHKPYEQTIREAEYPPPATPQQVYVTSGGTAVVVIAMLLLTIIILYITSRNAESAPYGIVGSVCFFLFGTPIGLLAVNRGWVEIYRVAQEQHTLRRYNDQQARIHAAQVMQVVDPPQLPYIPDTSTPAPLPMPSTFVAPVAEPDDSVKREATAWAIQLYGQDGLPDPDKVLTEQQTDKPDQVGRIRRKNPSRQAAQWLLEHRILKTTSNGYKLNVARYPTRDHVSNYIAQLTGVGGYRPSSPTPHHQATGEVTP